MRVQLHLDERHERAGAIAVTRRVHPLPRDVNHLGHEKQTADRLGQFTRIGHISEGGRPLLREGGPISYEPRPSRSSTPKPSALTAYDPAGATAVARRGVMCNV